MRPARAAALRHAAALLAAGLVAAGVSAACMGPSESARMRAAIEPHLDEMARHDRWARRISLADAAFRSEASLRETAFAPIRGSARVAAAWLDRVGPDARALRHPEGAPDLPLEGWVPVETEELGAVEAQARRMTIGERELDVVLVSRTREAPGGAQLRVTVAFGDAAR